MKEYVEQRDEGYWISGTRISLDSVVYAFLRGALPESIVRSYPLLTLEQVYGAITFYLANEQMIANYLRNNEAAFEALQQETGMRLRDAKPELYDRILAAREVETSAH